MILIFGSLSSVLAVADPWDQDNDPRNFDLHYNYFFSPTPEKDAYALPLKAMLPLKNMPWSSSYWPLNKGTINYAWNRPNPSGFVMDYRNPRTMTRQELEQLSPAQKLDVAMGRDRYDFSRDLISNADWMKKQDPVMGICDGWSATSIEFEEPKPYDFKRADGLVVPFGSSDIKALMSYDIAINQPMGSLAAVFVGSYCHGKLGMKLNTGNCKDINPGTFHVVLANQIGLMHQPFVADIDPGRETWNQPVLGYEFQVVGTAIPSDKAAKAYRIHAKMIYAEDDPEDPAQKSKVFNWNPTLGTENSTSATLELDYTLELDSANRIIGGEWAPSSHYTHPDLFWKPTRSIQFTDGFKILNQMTVRR